ncbi:MAG: hypothetical protein VXW31_05455, partial [Planctomycetota bacterium]|nr:hypothetical protein [Planctomycetota bacterium]
MSGHYLNSSSTSRQDFLGSVEGRDFGPLTPEELDAITSLRVDGPAPIACLPCPEGAICTDVDSDGTPRHNTRQSLRLNATWWRASPTSTDVRTCLPPYACDEPRPPGRSPTGDELCDQHHEGTRCAVCSAGAYRDLKEECVSCQETALTAVVATVAVACLLVAIGLYLLKKYWALPLALRKQFEATLARVQRKVRILIGFIQVLGQLPHAFPKLRFPTDFLRLLNCLPLFSFDIFTVFGTLGCVFEEWSYHQELLFATLWPAGAILLLLILSRVHARARGRYVYVALFISFLIFPR